LVVFFPVTRQGRVELLSLSGFRKSVARFWVGFCGANGS
jgi:hypothetical protein